MTWYSIFKRENISQESTFCIAEFFHLHKAVSPANSRAQSDKNNFRQGVKYLCRLPRIIQLRKKLQYRNGNDV